MLEFKLKAVIVSASLMLLLMICVGCGNQEHKSSAEAVNVIKDYLDSTNVDYTFEGGKEKQFTVKTEAENTIDVFLDESGCFEIDFSEYLNDYNEKHKNIDYDFITDIVNTISKIKIEKGFIEKVVVDKNSEYDCNYTEYNDENTLVCKQYVKGFYEDLKIFYIVKTENNNLIQELSITGVY